MTTENQTHIPEGWILTNFGDKNLFEILGSGISFFENEKDYYSTSSIENDKLVAIEQVITYRNRPSRANMQPVPSSVWFAKMKNTLKVLQPNQFQIDNVIFSTGFCGIKANYIDCSFLLQVLKSENFNTKKDNLAEGTTQVAVNNQHVKKIEFLLPCSIFEQQKIASILSKLDEAITQTEQLIAKYKKIKEGLMHDLLTRGIDEQGNIRSEETHKFKDSPLGRIPEEWEVVPFETFYKSPIRDFGSFSSTKLITFLEEGIPFIKSEMIEENNINWESVSFISYDVYKLLTKSYVNKNNILFSKIGSALGKAAIYNGEYLNCNSNAAVAKIDIDNNLALNEYVCAFLNSTFAKNQFSFMIISLLPRINLGDINKLLIFKLPVEEQSRIIQKLNKTQNLIDNTTDLISKLTSQKSGLMHDLLTGKIRVQI